jgi:hypothetical protein
VTASERDDFAVRRMIAGFGVEVACLMRMQALLKMFQQQRLLVARTYDQDRFAMLQCLIDTRKEVRIVVNLAGADRIHLVMQMLDRQLGMDRQFVDGIQAQKEDLDNAMVDPDGGVVMNSHGFSLCLNERSEWRR